MSLPDLELFATALQSIASSSNAAANLIKEATNGSDEASIDYSNGISLLGLKNSLMLEYMHNFIILTLARLHGQSISNVNEPSEDSAKSSKLVETLVKDRIILEKIRPLEAKLKYQVDKLVKKAQDHERTEQDRKSGKTASRDAQAEEDAAIANDPLAFKPNPGALLSRDASGSEASDYEDDEGKTTSRASKSGDGIYRPPRLAPVAYNEPTRGKKVRVPPAGNGLLRDLATSLTGSNPYIESTTGLSVTPTMQSRKAKKLAEIERYEEDNFTRLFMTKKDAKRRAMDEEDIALGGTGSREDYMSGAKGMRGRKSGFDTEFDDLLGTIGKKRKAGQADGYDALRAMKRDKRPAAGAGDNELMNVNGIPSENARDRGGSKKPKSRFENAVKRSRAGSSRGSSRGGSSRGRGRGRS